eukprot:TRINITY_DN20255_c0_g1_i1.p1 TRINITY_DN20255_c0_g1~~TRINITY_DN20255_c0_g1_i1.p1  ORF type:complete len:102 (-),score=18.91 TRINITY_DN20255_c0_g1_i1:69-335(-)
MGDAAEAKKMSQDHQKWIIDTLIAAGNTCDYNKLVEVGEEHSCDTVGAQLKILKNRKVINYKPIFLMYPMHGEEIVTLVKPDYDPYNP